MQTDKVPKSEQMQDAGTLRPVAVRMFDYPTCQLDDTTHWPRQGGEADNKRSRRRRSFPARFHRVQTAFTSATRDGMRREAGVGERHHCTLRGENGYEQVSTGMRRLIPSRLPGAVKPGQNSVHRHRPMSDADDGGGRPESVYHRVEGTTSLLPSSSILSNTTCQISHSNRHRSEQNCSREFHQPHQSQTPGSTWLPVSEPTIHPHPL